MALIRWLFGTGDFMAHGYCYMWNAALVRLHLFSDLGIGLAYVAISLTLVFLVRRARHEIPFSWMFLAFGMFIVACGATHLIEVWTLFTPVYWLSGCVKAITALASIATAVALPPLVPSALGMVRSSKVAEEQRHELGWVNEKLRREIAERSRAEAEVRQLNEQLEARVEERTFQLAQANMQLAERAAIVQHSRDAIFSHTLEGTVTNWNPAAENIYGYPAAEVIGKNASLLVPEEQSKDLAGVMTRIRNGEEIPSFETLRLRKDGTRIHVSMTISPIADEAGVIRAVSVIARDITEQKKAEQRMIETQKLESLGVIAGGVAHDFNNLLLGILGNASLALEDMPKGSACSAAIEQVIDASERAATLTQQLLAYAGKGRLVMKPVQVSEAVRAISSLVRTSIPKPAELRLELHDALPPVHADPGQLQQIIMNLVINGAEAIPENQKGTVTVRTAVEELNAQSIQRDYAAAEIQPGRYIAIEVEDTGIGMDDEVKSRIFDPFFTTKFTGRGLGLSAVIGAIHSHKGTIRVKTAPGRGTTMKVLLPVAERGVAERSVAEARPAAEAEGDLRGSGVILVVDDEEIVRQTAKTTLERYGYTVLLADNGQSGVEAFRQHADEIAVVILDMAMPVMGGEEALRVMRTIRPDAPVILSSGYTEMEAERRFAGERLAAFAQKPYAAATLARLVKRVMRAPSGQ